MILLPAEHNEYFLEWCSFRAFPLHANILESSLVCNARRDDQLGVIDTSQQLIPLVYRSTKFGLDVQQVIESAVVSGSPVQHVCVGKCL